MSEYRDLAKSLRHCAEYDCTTECPRFGIGEGCIRTMKHAAANAIEKMESQIVDLNKKVPQWISVEERLPETYRVVLVIKDHPVDYLHGYEFACRFHNGEWSGNSRKVLYWMYLPEPPTGGELNGD